MPDEIKFPDPPTEPCPACKVPTKGWPYFSGYMGMWVWSFLCTECHKKYNDFMGY